MIAMRKLFNAVLKLSEPLPHVHDVSTRLQAQINALVALAVIFVFLPVSLVKPLFITGLTPLAVMLRAIAGLLAVIVLMLAHRGYIRLSADLLISGSYGILWCIALFVSEDHENALYALDLFVLVTLFSTVVMPIRRAMVWWMLSFPLLLAVPLLRPDVPLRLLYGGTVLFHLAAGGTAIVVVGLLRRGERLMRDAAQSRERELKALMNHLPDYVVRMDTEFRYLFANEASQALLETPVDALTGRSPNEVLSRIQDGSIHSAIEQWKRVVEETIRTGKVQRAEIKTEGEGGFSLWFDIICAPEFDSRGKVASVLVVARDTTERRENEEALKESRALIQRIADTLPHMMFVFDPDPPPRGKLIFANRAMLTFFGCETEEDIPPSDSSPIPRLHPDDLKPLFDYFAARSEQAEQTPETIEVRLRRADGEWRWVRFWVFNFDDPQLKTGRMMGMIIDVTEERRMRDVLIEKERERTRAEAERQLNHLKTQMMIRIADQFRNPLAAIQSASDMLKRYYDRMSETQRSERFEQIKAQVTQISGLLDNMGAVLRQQDNQPEREQQPVRLSQLGAEILDEMRARYGDCHRVQFTCDRDAQTLINQESLRLILTHLLSNAFLYTPAGGEVTLEIRANDTELVLIVRDTGIGIEEVDGMRVFDPFYRGSNIDERPGLGLGLSIVRSQVLAHSGFIQLVSDTKSGTTVTVRLPNQRVLDSKMSGA